MKKLKFIALCAFNLILALSATLLPLKPTNVFAEDSPALATDSPPASEPTPACKDGYEYIESVGKCYKKCQDGWERNPETNRCRKIRVEITNDTASSDAPSSTSSGSPSSSPSTSSSPPSSSDASSAEKTAIPTCKDGYEYVSAADKCYKKCQDGWERNPETNRCRKVPVESEYETESAGSNKSSKSSGSSSKSTKTSTKKDPTSCKEGYEYVESAGKCYKACSDGQIRNPETNRCKKATAESSGLKECQEGYERNPDTNRCRKVKDNTGADFGVDVPNTGGGGSTFVAGGIIIALLTAGVAFVAFQYRLEIKEIIKKCFKKSEKSS